ncbi:hypothetical protein [Chryseobacterium salviniae]|uniref:Uncharacterized protein n=1 Tax=Chryseobacterium salviniae TaxID=3101750 RepID=A0ABU6HRU5_9FLAO|nr:hypothetical protein [Chryseobacterium sp. T9W2-O]MEC3875762.1 hypothetical protein [Chryseobacterium sp. T9W2-O]
MFPADCGRLPAIAVGFPQVVQDFRRSPEVPASCAGLPYTSGAFLQVVGNFRRPPLVSCKLLETSVDLRKGKTGVFVTSGFFKNKLFLILLSPPVSKFTT